MSDLPSELPPEDLVFLHANMSKADYDRIKNIPPIDGSKIEIPDRVTYTLNIVFQPYQEPPFQIGCRGVHYVKSKDEDPYQKTYRGKRGITSTVVSLDLGWVEDCPGIVVIENLETDRDSEPLLIIIDGPKKVLAKIFPGDPPFVARLEREILKTMGLSYCGEKESISVRVTCLPE